MVLHNLYLLFFPIFPQDVVGFHFNSGHTKTARLISRNHLEHSQNQKTDKYRITFITFHKNMGWKSAVKNLYQFASISNKIDAASSSVTCNETPVHPISYNFIMNYL